MMLMMMKGLALVLWLSGIFICSGSAIRGDEDQHPVSMMNNVLQKLENVSSQLQEHDGNLQVMTEGMHESLTQLQLGLDSIREVLPSEPLQDVINSALKNGLQELLQDESFPSCVAPPTAAISSSREAGKFYCFLDVDRDSAKGSCYFLSSDTATWSNARDKCFQMGADLVKLETEEEFTFLESQTVADTWIGLTDQQVEGQYTWVVDGSLHVPTNYPSMWLAGEPNNSRGVEDCIYFYHNHHLLNDVTCDIEKRYLCEMLYKEILL